MSDKISKINEYAEKFQIISEQAESDGRGYVKQFLQELLKHQPSDLQLYNFIFMTVDELTEPMVDLYIQFLKDDAALDWYTLISFVNDEYDNPGEYYDFILKCKRRNVGAHEIREALNSSSSFAEFENKLDFEMQMSEEKNMDHGENSNGNMACLIDHLTDENKQLNKRLDDTLKALSEARKELKSTMEESFSNRKIALERKLELEQLRKSSNAATLAVKLAEGKAGKNKNRLIQLESIIERLHEEKGQLENENTQLKQKLEENVATIKKMQQEIEEYVHTVNQLSDELSLKRQEMSGAMSQMQSVAEPEMSVALEDTDFDIPSEPYWSEPDIVEPEKEENDYSEEDLIAINDNRDEIVKHTNLFAMLIKGHQEKKFKKKTVSEQESMIFAKMMEQKYSRTKLLAIKKVLTDNAALSRFELYKLISKNASDDELSQFCGVTVST